MKHVHEFKGVSAAPTYVGSVLVADDDETALRLNAMVLCEMGFETYLAATGTEAVQLFETKRDSIGLALLDIDMPGLTGIEVSRRLRAAAPQLPIVFVSGCEIDSLQQHMEEIGLATFLPKPYLFASLRQAVMEAVRSAATNATSPYTLNSSAPSPETAGRKLS